MTSRFQANKVLWAEIRRCADVARHVDAAVARLAGDGPKHSPLKAGDRLGASMPLEKFLHEMDLSPTVLRPLPNASRCLTIHSSKGMEFEDMHVVGLVEDQPLSFQVVKKGPDSREERRNCFVVIALAQEWLMLMSPTSYWCGVMARSRFLAQIEVTGGEV